MVADLLPRSFDVARTLSQRQGRDLAAFVFSEFDLGVHDLQKEIGLRLAELRVFRLSAGLRHQLIAFEGNYQIKPRTHLISAGIS